MKKSFILCITIILALAIVGLSGCGNGNQNEKPAGSTAAVTEAETKQDNGVKPASMYTAGQNINTVATPDSASPVITGEIETSDGIEVTAIPLEPEHYSPRLVMLITNNSGKECSVYLKVDFLDKDGSIIETDEEDAVDAIPNGATVPVAWGLNESGKTFAGYRIKAEINKSDDRYYVIDDYLKYDYQKSDAGVNFTVTNTSAAVAHWVNTHVMFMKDGKLVDYHFETCGGQEITEIQPGETVTTKVEKYIEGDFDDVMIFVHGECWGF